MGNKEENLSDSLTNMINSISERFKSPFAGNFIITWLTFNWKIPYITLFLDQDHTGYNNKLVAIKNVLDTTPFCNLFIYPFVITCLLIFAIPGLNYLAGLFPSYLKFRKSKEDNEREQQLNGLKHKFTTVKNELDNLNKLTTNDILMRIGYHKEPVDRIFPGTWKIFIEYANTSNHHNSCYMKDNTFIDENLKTPVVTIKSIIANTDKHDKRPIAVCIIGQTTEEYSIHLAKRDEIHFQGKENHLHRIVFNWINISTYYP